MNKTSLIITLFLVIIFGWAFIAKLPDSGSSPTAKTISEDRPNGGDFTLTSFTGPISLSDFKEKLVFIYFGYTFCPDICPTNLANLANAYQQLESEVQEQVQILLVSVDPERDTPERLQKYSSYFHAGIIGLTGDKQRLDEIAKRYGVIYAIRKDTDEDQYYSVDHSAFTYVVDQSGKLATQLPHATGPEVFIKTIKQYIKHSE